MYMGLDICTSYSLVVCSFPFSMSASGVEAVAVCVLVDDVIGQ